MSKKISRLGLSTSTVHDRLFSLGDFWGVFLGLIFITVGLLTDSSERGEDGSSARNVWFAIGATFAVIGIVQGLLNQKASRRENYLKSTGIKGTARIQNISTAGSFSDGSPTVDAELDLRVSVPGKHPYIVHCKTKVPIVMLGRLNQTEVLHVKVHPYDPKDVLIDWSRFNT